ncbi:MAG: hypothetical protein JO307_06970, partial [Bryobacterales bacterium]|nr:hypothetical protein [Bryobacterales bacterium]
LRRLRPGVERPYRAFGYPLIPGLYLVGAVTILVVLLVYRPLTTLPGMAIVLLGVPVFLAFRRNAGGAPNSLKEEKLTDEADH